MTVCIGAICNKGDDMIYVTDTLLSYRGSGSADAVIKLTSHKGWAYGFAGGVSHVHGILTILEKRSTSTDRPKSVLDVQRSLVEAYSEYLANLCADRVLLPYGLTMNDFVKDGRQRFGDELFRQLNAEIQAVREECDAEFLVGGWEEETDTAQMFSYTNYGGIVSHSMECFGAIGAGGPLAGAQIIAHKFTRFWKFEDSLYLACIAKFTSESEPGVGKNTFGAFIRKQEETVENPEPGIVVTTKRGASLLREKDIEPIRKLWDAEGKPKLPAGAETAVNQVLKVKL